MERNSKYYTRGSSKLNRPFVRLESKDLEPHLKARDIEWAAKRAKIFKEIESWFNEERKKDPKFRVTMKKLDSWAKRNNESIFGLRSATGITRYWYYNLGALNDKLDLSAKLRKEES